MFRSRFSEAFPKNLPHFGPQDIERGVVDPLPTPQVESLLCALLGLVLNRKKYIESVGPLYLFWGTWRAMIMCYGSAVDGHR